MQNRVKSEVENFTFFIINRFYLSLRKQFSINKNVESMLYLSIRQTVLLSTISQIDVFAQQRDCWH